MLSKNAQLVDILTALYYGFDKKYMPAYQELRRATVLVLNKVKHNDHPEGWGNKLAMFLEARVNEQHIPLSHHQADLIHQLNQLCKHPTLNYIYLSPIDAIEQFEN